MTFIDQSEASIQVTCLDQSEASITYLAGGGRSAPLDAVLHVLHDVLHPAVRVLEAGGQQVDVLPVLVLHTDPLRVLPHQAAGAQPGRPPRLLASPGKRNSYYLLTHILKGFE